MICGRNGACLWGIHTNIRTSRGVRSATYPEMVQGKQVICTLLVIFMKTQCIILENTSFSLVPGGHRILILGADRVNLIPHFFADIDFNSHKLQTVTLSTSRKDEGES